MHHPNIPEYNYNVTIHVVTDLMRMDRSVEVLKVDSTVCNDKSHTVLDLSSFSHLKEFEVGDCSFSCINEVKLVGLKRLEKVVIGRNSFKGYSYDVYKDGVNPERRFYLKNCERLKELKVGRFSFADFSMCEIENVDRLKVIEMGKLGEESYNFKCASLELKSSCYGME